MKRLKQAKSWVGLLWLVLGVPYAGFGQDVAVPGEILVRFKTKVAQNELVKEAKRLGLSGQSLRNLQSGLLSQEGMTSINQVSALHLERIKVPAGITEDEAIRRLATSPMVEYSCLNYYRSLMAYPNDPLYQQGYGQWATSIGADKVVAENLLPSGYPVTIAVLDTGVYLEHEDLAGRLASGSDFIRPGRDGNVENYGLTCDDPFYWAYSHGTHVAGIAAASTNNNLGITGVASAANISIMPVKVGDLFLDSRGDTVSAIIDSAAIEGIIWAVDHGARVLNMSFGGFYENPAFKEAIQYAYDHGCISVVSAGNYAQTDVGSTIGKNPIMYPAAYPHVIAVASCDLNGNHAYYSEYRDYVDVAAPGGCQTVYTSNTAVSFATRILSTVPYGHFAGDTTVIKYYALQGTSMAAPMVAGTAAMLLAQNPKLTPEEVENIITSTAEKTGSLAAYGKAWDPYLGWGRLNLYRALTRGSNATYESQGGRAAYNYPNPFNPNQGEKTYIVIPVEPPGSPSSAKVTIFDIAGHRVHSLDISADEIWAGRGVAWDGCNDQGDLVTNGIYPFVVQVGSKTYFNKIAVNNQ